jgi:hypothetical protein
MAWKFDESKGLEPLPGIPLEAEDKDFDAAVAEYESQFEDGKGSVKKTGLYKRVAREELTPEPEPEPEV